MTHTVAREDQDSEPSSQNSQTPFLQALITSLSPTKEGDMSARKRQKRLSEYRPDQWADHQIIDCAKTTYQSSVNQCFSLQLTANKKE
jgi:hypothetical protein